MAEHLCTKLDGWVEGTVASCPHHHHIGDSAPDVRPHDDRRFIDITAGIARSGQVSKKGTVTGTQSRQGPTRDRRSQIVGSTLVP